MMPLKCKFASAVLLASGTILVAGWIIFLLLVAIFAVAYFLIVSPLKNMLENSESTNTSSTPKVSNRVKLPKFSLPKLNLHKLKIIYKIFPFVIVLLGAATLDSDTDAFPLIVVGGAVTYYLMSLFVKSNNDDYCEASSSDPYMSKRSLVPDNLANPITNAHLHGGVCPSSGFTLYDSDKYASPTITDDSWKYEIPNNNSMHE